MPSLSPEQLAEISRRTCGHYDTNAEDFWLGTRDHDVSQNIEALLDAIFAAAPDVKLLLSTTTTINSSSRAVSTTNHVRAAGAVSNSASLSVGGI